MQITFNNLQSPENILCLAQVPNILTIKDSPEEKEAVLLITVTNTSAKNIIITVNGITIQSTDNINNVYGNFFYWSEYADKKYVAYTIVNALLNSNLSANYNINQTESIVYIRAKQAGAAYNITYSGNGFFFQNTTVTDNSQLTNSIIQINVGTDTFQKTFINEKLSFNLSPYFQTNINNGEIDDYYIFVNNIKNTTYNRIGNVHINAINGYKLTPNSPDYITLTNNHTLLQDVYNGNNNSTYTNNTTLYYLPDENIPITLYNKNLNDFNITFNYLSSSFQTLETETLTVKPAAYHTVLYTPKQVNYAYYLEVQIPDVGTLIYNNIDNNKYTNKKDVQTLYFYNSFGGMSHFTFSQKREDTYKTEKEVIENNILEYYNNPNTKKVYSNNTTHTVTLTTHYTDLSGTYTLQDLNKSSEVWYYDNNNVKRIVIINEVNITKINNKQYQATITYEE